MLYLAFNLHTTSNFEKYPIILISRKKNISGRFLNVITWLHHNEMVQEDPQMISRFNLHASSAKQNYYDVLVRYSHIRIVYNVSIIYRSIGKHLWLTIHFLIMFNQYGYMMRIWSDELYNYLNKIYISSIKLSKNIY